MEVRARTERARHRSRVPARPVRHRKPLPHNARWRIEWTRQAEGVGPERSAAARRFSHHQIKAPYSRDYCLISRYDITVASRENSTSVSTLLRAIPEELRPEWDGLTVRIVHGQAEWTFRPVWVGEGLPADAKRGRDEIAHGIGAPPDAIPVVTARRISPGAREILESASLSWADASGRAHIDVPGRLYIARFEPIRADAGREFKWSAAADAIAETLLTWRVHQPGEEAMPVAKVTEVAQTADVSLAHAARVLRHFDEQRYTAKTGAERGRSATRELREPGRMLSDWAGHHAASAWPGGVEFHVPWREPQQTVSMLAEVLSGEEWALTGEVAADRIAPYLTSVPTVDIYVPMGALSHAVDELALHPEAVEVESGGRVRIHPADPYLFRLTQEVRGVRTVSPVRVYADLLRGRGRSREAGEYLREVAIGF
jgi:hypothetical protein